MSKFVINGNKELEGSIEVRGAKNATFPLLAASLLTDEDCVIKNIPLIEDVLKMIKILKSIGVSVKQKERTLILNSSGLDLTNVKKDLVKKLRGSVLFYGPLLARLGELELPPPGGCLIGARPIDTHLDAFEQLGVNVEQKGQTYRLTKERKGSTTCVLNEMSVTGTENAVLLSALSPYETTIKIADLDYPVRQLLDFLQKMGVEVETGHHVITIKGKEDLSGAEHTIMSDPIEAGTFALTALATNSEITIEGFERDFLELFLKKLEQSGANFELGDETLKMKHWNKLKINKVQSLPYPGLHTDLQSAWAVAATQAEGSTLIHDPLYEGRFRYLEELTRMGADILFADPHRVVVGGPSDLYGRDLGSFDLRGGAALIIAALMAEGKSSIEDTYQIDRGYEKIEKRLQKVGADIKKV